MKQTILAALIVLTTTLSCGNGANDQAFFPSNHDTAVNADAISPDGIRDGYRTFDRAAIQKTVAEDDRYAPLIDKDRERIEKLIAMSDDQLRSLIPPANTIRALMVNTQGCPVHGGGTSVYQPFGIKIDLDHPLQVKCPIGGEVYPNADFPDDGSGWVDDRPGSPTEGEKYYFVGWFNHWFLQQLPTFTETMARLWYITGEDVYAEKAVVLLERFMEVYPDMDGNDLTYDGSDWGVYVKMLPTMWEGSALMNLVDTVELLLPRLDDDFLGRFHASVFRPAFEAYRENPAPSNWGNVWNAPFARFATITGDREILDYMLYEHPVAVAPTLDNQFFRDGFPYEAAFGYGTHYMYDARNIADVFADNGGWIWEHPHLKSSFEAFAEIIILDKYTHHFGDTGGLKNTGLTLRPALLEEAYRHYKSPLIARHLLQAYTLHGSGRSFSIGNLFSDYDPPDRTEIEQIAAQAEPPASTLAPVRGFAIMRTGEDENRAALFFDYGYAHPAHSHADRLNINLFALDREFIPEMGYPEYMDSIQPTPGGWTTHTVSHATVQVNEKRQLEGSFGDLHAFVDADGVKYVDASCEDAYVHCDVNLFRRSLAMIDIPGGAYVVDIFRVAGGEQHDYLFHGQPVDMTLDGVSMSEPRKGTLAGEDVAFGEKPDDVLPYHVDNKGYQYLYDVREGSFDGSYEASWTFDDGVGFNAVFLPDDGESFLHTTGYPRPSSKNLPPMPFLVRRVRPDNDNDISIFASVLGYGKDGAPEVTAERLPLSADSSDGACAILITHPYGRDVVLSALSLAGYVKTADGRFELSGQFGAASWRDGGKGRMTLAGGTSFTVEGETVTLDTAEATAVISAVHDDKLVLDKPLPAWANGEKLLGLRGDVQTTYHVEDIEGAAVRISPSTWIGRGRADSLDTAKAVIYDSRDVFPLGEKRNRLADITGMKYPEGNRNYYAGSWLVTKDGRTSYRLSSGGYPGFVLADGQDTSRLERDFPKGREFLLYDVGPGDTVRVLKWVSEEREM